MRWTEYLRPLVHPSESERLFLFVPPRGKRPASSFHSKWGSLLSGSWEYGYHQFLKEHGLGPLGTRRFRVTGLEIVHQVTGGDLPAMQAWANHTRASATERNYEGAGGKQHRERSKPAADRSTPISARPRRAGRVWIRIPASTGRRIRCVRPTPGAPFVRWVASTSNRRTPVHRHMTYWRR